MRMVTADYQSQEETTKEPQIEKDLITQLTRGRASGPIAQISVTLKICGTISLPNWQKTMSVSWQTTH